MINPDAVNVVPTPKISLPKYAGERKSLLEGSFIMLKDADSGHEHQQDTCAPGD